MNQISYYALTPQDAWFFRDGRPYNKGESNQADAVSQFPPSPRTMSGALRAALARANGWNKGRTWDAGLHPILGNGPDDLGMMQCEGPFLLKGGQSLFPAPLHLLGKLDGEKGCSQWKPCTLLRPAQKTTLTDRGEIALPEIDPHVLADGLNPAEHRWLKQSGYQRLLAGNLPDAEDLITRGSLWHIEHRVGLHRNASTLQTDEGALYSPAFVRLYSGVELGFGVGFETTNRPVGFKTALPALFTMGGESRMTLCEPLTSRQWLPDCPQLQPVGNRARFLVVALTPLPAQQNADVASALGIAGAKCCTACVGKPVFFGGWDSLNGKPLPLEPFHPAGSVWFCEAPQTAINDICLLHGQWIGAKRLSAHGFGQIAIGCWPQQDNN